MRNTEWLHIHHIQTCIQKTSTRPPGARSLNRIKTRKRRKTFFLFYNRSDCCASPWRFAEQSERASINVVIFIPHLHRSFIPFWDTQFAQSKHKHRGCNKRNWWCALHCIHLKPHVLSIVTSEISCAPTLRFCTDLMSKVSVFGNGVFKISWCVG